MSADGPPGSGPMPHAPPAASLVGEVLDGRYRIIKKLGEGGMGEVYAAEHVHIAKRYAIKLLRSEILSNPEAVTRFKQEAHSSSTIGHRNIIQIEDFGFLQDGRIYMCMELLNGAALNDLIMQPQPVERLLNILIQTGHGLAAAHAKNIVHRDMKPENIFVTIGPSNEDIPKLLDFGIAKVAGNDGQNNLTRTGTIFGTPFYMAPEQALGNPVDARTDIYAVGVIMYEVFSGSLPFQGESFMGILTQHITTEPEPVAQRAQKTGRTLPPGLADVITRCMQKNPAHRFSTMDELVAALVEIYRGIAGAGMSTYMEAFPVSSAHPIATPSPTAASTVPGKMQTQIAGGPPPGMHPAASAAGPSSSGSAAVGALASGASGVYDPGASFVAPKKSKAGLYIGIFAVLAVGGGVAAFMATQQGTSGEGAGSGAGSQVATTGSGSGSSATTGSAATGDGSGSSVATVGSNGSATTVAGTPDKMAEYVAKMTGYADQMCACADKACADKVQNELGAWAASMGGTVKPDDASAKQLATISERLSSCASKLIAAAGSNAESLPPDAGVAPIAVVNVVVSTNVAAFEIWENGAKIASGPDSLEVPVGSSRKLTIKARGYRDRDVTLDSKSKKQKFTLSKAPSTTTTPNTNNTSNPPPKCTGTNKDLQSNTCRPLYCKAHPDEVACDIE
ncbi:MAG TPA: serine/threonine-protein kinase [Kofleriaceae bacterium]|nr:serine/threonine-protein kinase [Kofleriaceae bacterium]